MDETAHHNKASEFGGEFFGFVGSVRYYYYVSIASSLSGRPPPTG